VIKCVNTTTDKEDLACKEDTKPKINNPANKPKIGLVMKNLNGIFKGGAWSKDKEELNIKLIS